MSGGDITKLTLKPLQERIKYNSYSMRVEQSVV